MMIVMFAIIVLTGVFQSIFISLGVGSSTLAIVNFFAAIADGTIDETERRMMGIVYVVLRVAMVGILATTAILLIPMLLTGVSSLTVVSIAQLGIVAVLFINAALMTARLMPSTFGPGLQAGSWYALGVVAGLQLQGVTSYSLVQFGLGYVALLILAVGLVNGVMAIIKAKKQPPQPTA